MPERFKRTPVSCPKKRQLSGVDRKCDRGFGHVGVHHATTVTGVDRYWIIGVPVEFASEADAVKRRDLRDAYVIAEDAQDVTLFDLGADT